MLAEACEFCSEARMAHVSDIPIVILDSDSKSKSAQHVPASRTQCTPNASVASTVASTILPMPPYYYMGMNQFPYVSTPNYTLLVSHAFPASSSIPVPVTVIPSASRSTNTPVSSISGSTSKKVTNKAKTDPTPTPGITTQSTLKPIYVPFPLIPPPPPPPPPPFSQSALLQFVGRFVEDAIGFYLQLYFVPNQLVFYQNREIQFIVPDAAKMVTTGISVTLKNGNVIIVNARLITMKGGMALTLRLLNRGIQ